MFYYRHQDVAKCLPGQSLRINVADASRHLAQTYETDFEVCNYLPKMHRNERKSMFIT